ncbi:hypothetical protein FPV67DRAFT_787693 [Lyophyllum atratum]|nr:hypothetical protein FPV67DRAFT_787693 [Lyophyllum atratum]
MPSAWRRPRVRYPPSEGASTLHSSSRERQLAPHPPSRSTSKSSFVDLGMVCMTETVPVAPGPARLALCHLSSCHSPPRSPFVPCPPSGRPLPSPCPCPPPPPLPRLFQALPARPSRAPRISRTPHQSRAPRLSQASPHPSQALIPCLPQALSLRPPAPIACLLVSTQTSALDATVTVYVTARIAWSTIIVRLRITTAFSLAMTASVLAMIAP